MASIESIEQMFSCVKARCTLFLAFTVGFTETRLRSLVTMHETECTNFYLRLRNLVHTEIFLTFYHIR